jgi:hypothetical protein
MFRWFSLLCKPTSDTRFQSASSSLKTPAIHSRYLEFITDHVGNLSPSLEGSYSDAVVGGMTHSGTPSLHAILEESPSEDDSSLSKESSNSPLPSMCNKVTSAAPIMTMPPLEETPVF